LAARVLQELDADYARIRTGSFQDVAEEWQSHCITLGREVTITMGTRQIRGRAESLDDDGALIVRSEYGHLERITGGDVTLDK
jgi:BirA family biotin operon repressor/biotin-[acetyl-CoA-carboxylase] ligase